MKVDFYVIDSNSRMQALRELCLLLEKPYADQEPVHIHASTQEEADLVDRLLWTYREDSFLAHQLETDSEDDAPIQIGINTEPTKVPDKNNSLLVNLTTEIPEYYHKFNRVIELVFTDQVAQQLGRERYREYRKLGCELMTHKIKAN